MVSKMIKQKLPQKTGKMERKIINNRRIKLSLRTTQFKYSKTNKDIDLNKISN